MELNFNLQRERERSRCRYKKNLKVGLYVGAYVVSKANQLLRTINRTFKFKGKDAMVLLFKSVVCPRLG